MRKHRADIHAVLNQNASCSWHTCSHLTVLHGCNTALASKTCPAYDYVKDRASTPSTLLQLCVEIAISSGNITRFIAVCHSAMASTTAVGLTGSHTTKACNTRSIAALWNCTIVTMIDTACTAHLPAALERLATCAQGITQSQTVDEEWKPAAGRWHSL